MNVIVIDLSEPFEKVLATALSLPRDDNARTSDAAIKQAARYLYQAANGRIVETQIGAIPIAPPLSPSLKVKPLHLKSAAELVTFVKDHLGIPDCPDHARPERQTPHYASFGSALLEFMAGGLGAPECWPDQRHVGASSNGAVRNGSSAISRWENEGGKTLASPRQMASRQHDCNQPKQNEQSTYTYHTSRSHFESRASRVHSQENVGLIPLRR